MVEGFRDNPKVFELFSVRFKDTVCCGTAKNGRSDAMRPDGFASLAGGHRPGLTILLIDPYPPILTRFAKDAR